MSVLKSDSVKVPFVKAGAGPIYTDGLVHKKTVSYIIIAQALEGHYEIQCDGRPSVILEQGEAFLTAPGVPLVITHHFAPKSSKMRMRWIHFNVNVFDSICLSTLVDFPVRMEQPWAEKIGRLSNKIHSIQRRDSATSLYAMVQVNAISFEIISILLEFLESKGIHPKFDPGMQRLLPSLEFARRHLAERITVGDLAKKVGLSIPRFHAEFKMHFAEAPFEHLRKIRLTKACDLLRGTGLLLEEIAAETGFCSQFHFSREFKKAYGESPSNYRQTIGNGHSLY